MRHEKAGMEPTSGALSSINVLVAELDNKTPQ
jgi:hypothetical protein